MVRLCGTGDGVMGVTDIGTEMTEVGTEVTEAGTETECPLTTQF
jgi:hypothetical protein